MALPVYVLFSESGAIDEPSNKASVFDIVEIIAVRESKENTPDAKLKKPKGYRLIAAWLKEESDSEEDVFQCQIACVDPKGKDILFTEITEFCFAINKPFYRTIIPNIAFNGSNHLGIHTFESRIRAKGSQDWASVMRFPFLVNLDKT